MSVAFVKNGVEHNGGFEAFGFVDGHEPDGIEVRGCIGGEPVFLLVKPFDEFCQVVPVAVCVFCHNIEECGYVGCLDVVKVEHAHHLFAAVVEVESAEQRRVELYAVGCQQAVEVDGLAVVEEGGVDMAGGKPETAQVQHHAGGGNTVGAVKEVLQHVAHQHHGTALAEQERFARDNGDVMGCKVCGNLAQGAVVTGKNGDVAEAVALAVG